MSDSNSSLVLHVDNVSKKFCRNLHRSLRYGMVDLYREAIGLGPTPGLRKGEFYAIRDVSLRVGPGESVALMGANGAGKSTLLKMVHGLIRPDAGRIRVRGRMGALTQLGAGFNPILSGRENVYINAAILGFSKADVDRRLEQMLDFAGIRDAIEDPIRTYSSGMRARLGYSIAAFLQPDLLLMDEVLATGDIAFRMKCYAHLESLIDQGTSIIIVTHMIGRIARACSRFVVLDHGGVHFDGDVDEGLRAYRRVLKLQDSGTDNESDDRIESGTSNPTPLSADESDEGNANEFLESTAIPSGSRIVAAPLGLAWIESIKVLDQRGHEISQVEHNAPIRIRVVMKSDQPVRNLRLRLLFENDGDLLTVVQCPRKFFEPLDRERVVEVSVPRMSLLSGSFRIRAMLLGGVPPQQISEKQITLQVLSRLRRGLFTLPHRWISVGKTTSPS